MIHGMILSTHSTPPKVLWHGIMPTFWGILASALDLLGLKFHVFDILVWKHFGTQKKNAHDNLNDVPNSMFFVALKAVNKTCY